MTSSVPMESDLTLICQMEKSAPPFSCDLSVPVPETYSRCWVETGQGISGSFQCLIAWPTTVLYHLHYNVFICTFKHCYTRLHKWVATSDSLYE